MLRGKYRVPFYMSTDCENILRRFLVLNPAKRCTLEVRGPGSVASPTWQFAIPGRLQMLLPPLSLWG